MIGRFGARTNGAKVIVLNLDQAAIPMLPGDPILELPAEQALPAIAALLGCYPAVGSSKSLPRASLPVPEATPATS